MEKLHRDLAGVETGWVWAVQVRVEFDMRSENFTSLHEFRKWIFDPEFRILREQRVYPGGGGSEIVPLFWPSVALRLVGFDVAAGFCIRAPITHLIEVAE